MTKVQTEWVILMLDNTVSSAQMEAEKLQKDPSFDQYFLSFAVPFVTTQCQRDDNAKQHWSSSQNICSIHFELLPTKLWSAFQPNHGD